MRKVMLTLKEQEKYNVIKKLLETNGNKKRAAKKSRISERQINRLIAGYKEFGKQFFVHDNRGRKPVNALSFELKIMLRICILLNILIVHILFLLNC